MDFSSDANAYFEGLLEANREIRMPQAAEETPPDTPPHCAMAPYYEISRERGERHETHILRAARALRAPASLFLTAGGSTGDG